MLSQAVVLHKMLLMMLLQEMVQSQPPKLHLNQVQVDLRPHLSQLQLDLKPQLNHPEVAHLEAPVEVNWPEVQEVNSDTINS